jgi:hypothetical protein
MLPKKVLHWSAGTWKAKVICARLYEQRIADKQALDEQQIHAGQRDAPRDEAAIAGTRM